MRACLPLDRHFERFVHEMLAVGEMSGYRCPIPQHFLFISRGIWKALFFSPQYRLYFYHALWPFIYFTHFPHKIIYLKKRIQPPPPFSTVAPY